MAFRSNSNDYDIITEGELAAILRNFDPDMIYNVLENNMVYKYREYEVTLTNIVTSLEYTFKMIIDQYGDDIAIKNKRDAVYQLIIKRICEFHRLEYPIIEDNTDIYALASIMYEFFVSNFVNNISKFFVSYIFREKESIYNMALTFDDDKKIKNISITYAKKIYEADPEIGVIHAFAPKIAESMTQFPITIHQYIDGVYSEEKEKAAFLKSVLPDNDDFYPNYVVPYILNFGTRIVIDIRLSLQNIIGNKVDFLPNDTN